MTVQEANEYLKQLFEEVEQYRALEEKLNGISVEHIVNAFIERVEKDTNEGYEKGRILTNVEADMWEQYRALGTVEELKAAKEKQIPKKVTRRHMKNINGDVISTNYYCPICDELLREDFDEYCPTCGKALKWGEEDD